MTDQAPASGNSQTATGAIAQQRPDWAPVAHWDAQGGKLADGFGAHYTELARFHRGEIEARTLLDARSPEDIKFAVPKDLQAPDGMQFQIDEGDPRIPAIREM